MSRWIGVILLAVMSGWLFNDPANVSAGGSHCA